MWGAPKQLQPRERHLARRHLLHGDELESERFDLGEYPVERSLIRELAGEDGVGASPVRSQSREGMQQRAL
jgi:hypothetical protein